MSEIKTVSALVTHLEGVEGEVVDKQFVIDTLKEITARPASNGQRRGQLAGLTVETMTDEQLKREIINANSVLYKAKQRGASDETIAKNQARVDAAMAEKAKRQPEAPATEVSADAAEGENVYSESVESEL